MEPLLPPSGSVPPYRFITISIVGEQFIPHLFMQVSIKYGRSNWEELFTKHQRSHDLQKVIDSGIAIVTADRKVSITLQEVNRKPYFVVLPWCVRTYFVVLPWCVRTYFVVLPWCVRTYFVVLPWCVRTYFVVLPWCVRTYFVVRTALVC